MRTKGKKDKEEVVRKWFAFLPVNINGDERWLETVTVKGYWWYGSYSGNWWWTSIEFVD
jgi:hypothetical protein